MRPFTRRSILLAAAVANGLQPIRNSRAFTTPSFFASWLATELAGPILAINLLATARAKRRGDLKGSEGAVALTLRAASTAGLLKFVSDGMRADEEFAAALSPWMTTAELADRPLAARLGKGLPVISGAVGGSVIERNVRYTPDDYPARLSLDVYKPKTPAADGERRPAIIQIHGGGWVIGDKREQGIPLLNHLARNGWVGFNVNYRLSPKAKAPDHLIDCKQAIAWVREHADEYGVDPDFIAVTGGSAGGHLAAMVALTANDPEYQPGFEDVDTAVQAAVPFYGVYDVTDRDGNMLPGFMSDFIEPMVMGSRIVEDPDAFERYSPAYRVHADAPPSLIIHGSNDVLVPVEIARSFAERLSTVSTSAVAYAELQGAQHAFDVFASPRTVRTVEYVERFLDGVRRGAIK
jgi:acetyl esterase/lipase